MFLESLWLGCERLDGAAPQNMSWDRWWLSTPTLQFQHCAPCRLEIFCTSLLDTAEPREAAPRISHTAAMMMACRMVSARLPTDVPKLVTHPHRSGESGMWRAFRVAGAEG